MTHIICFAFSVFLHTSKLVYFLAIKEVITTEDASPVTMRLIGCEGSFGS